MLYRIADVVFEAKTKYDYSKEIHRDYEYFGNDKPEFSVTVTEKEIEYERSLAPFSQNFPDYYLESLAVFRALCNYLLDNKNGIIFHSSAVEIEGKAYLFTAPSGTGKSTHARLLKELLGDKLSYINDDKPIIRYVDGEFYVYGTPWTGKHFLGENKRVVLGAIVSIYRSEENRIKKVSPKEILFPVIKQTLRPKSEEQTDNLFNLISKMLESVPCYRLGANMDISAAKLSYRTLTGREQ